MNAVTGIRQFVRMSVRSNHLPEHEMPNEFDTETFGAQPSDDVSRLLDPVVAEVGSAGAGELHPILFRQLSARGDGREFGVLGDHAEAEGRAVLTQDLAQADALLDRKSVV